MGLGGIDEHNFEDRPICAHIFSVARLYKSYA